MRSFATLTLLIGLPVGALAATPRPTHTPSFTARARAYEAAHPGVHRVGGVVTEPRELSRVNPRFPETARKRKRVLSPIVLMAVVSETGTVLEPTIIRSDHPDLDPAVLEAVKQWRYEPTRVNGRPVAVFLTVTVSF